MALFLEHIVYTCYVPEFKNIMLSFYESVLPRKYYFVQKKAYFTVGVTSFSLTILDLEITVMAILMRLTII